MLVSGTSLLHVTSTIVKSPRLKKGMINVTFTTILELAAGLDVHPKKLLDYE